MRLSPQSNIVSPNIIPKMQPQRGNRRHLTRPGPYSKQTSLRPTDGSRSYVRAQGLVPLVLGQDGGFAPQTHRHDLPSSCLGGAMLMQRKTWPMDTPMSGGWISDLESPNKTTMWQLTITPQQCPPAFLVFGDLGALILVALLIQRGQASLLRLQVALVSDNQGNVYALY